MKFVGDFIELQVVLKDTDDRPGIEFETPLGTLRYENILIPRIHGHPADSEGTITGVCTVCNEPVAHHRSYKDKEGNVVEIVLTQEDSDSVAYLR